MASLTHDKDRWKREQIECYRQYLATFRVHSREYDIILKGIRDLEKSL